MKNNPSRRKSQLSIFYLSIIATLLILTMITVNIGKIAKDKTYTANSADAGAISSASVMAFAFNYVAEANKNQDKGLEGNWKDFEKVYTKHFKNAKAIKEKFDEHYNTATTQGCCEEDNICGIAQAEAKLASQNADQYRKQMKMLIDGAWPASQEDKDQTKGQGLGIIPNYAQEQENFFKSIKKRVQDDNEGQNDLYHIALSAGCKYNLFNSGFPVKMGEDSKMFFEFVDEECSPENVRSGQAVTFTWADKAGRSHTVTATTTIQEAKTFDLVTTQMKRSGIKTRLEQARDEAENAKKEADLAATDYAKTCPYPDQWWSSICWSGCPGDKIAGDDHMFEAFTSMAVADMQAVATEQGLNADGSLTTDKKDGTNKDVIKYIKDIQHDRNTSSMAFQKHQGGVIKSPRETPDTPTFYPPVQSSSGASFRGGGSIYPQKPSHDSKLNK